MQLCENEFHIFQKGCVMKLSRHYIRLRESYPHIREEQELLVTLDELAAVLDCTHRNAVLVLKRMAEEGWLKWEPKRGRGRPLGADLHGFRGGDDAGDGQVARGTEGFARGAGANERGHLAGFAEGPVPQLAQRLLRV
ncbi:SgrR family transcriptional regulator [Paenibacillus sp. P25]|nr:SgrR family transcriptional regulator [Paenibacillus sp. P25]